MITYSQEEIDRINKIKETNDRLEDFFQSKREEWNKLVNPIYITLKLELNHSTSAKFMDAQSLCLSYRQLILEQISVFLEKRSKQDVKLKKVKQDKFMFYATGFGIKTNMGEKTLLIDAHVAEETRNIELIDIYLEFLRSTNKNLEAFSYSLKNIVELFNYLK
jgi:hypothetical protein